jgi:hypothetical protein
MNKRVTLMTAAVLCVLLVALAISVAACGGSTTTTTAAPVTTAAPATTTTAASTSDTGATATTAAGGTTPASIQMTADVQAYLAQMQTLFGSLQSVSGSASPLDIKDVSTVTDAQIQGAEAMLAQMKTALDGMSKLQPPAALASFHQTLAATIQKLYDDASKAITALKAKDQAAFDAAKADSDKVVAEMENSLQQLIPLMMGGTTASS